MHPAGHAPGQRHDAWHRRQPTPPSNDYVALGVCITQGSSTPAADAVMCVKKTHNNRAYARSAELSDPVSPLHAFRNLRYNVAPLYPHADTEEHLILPTGRLSYSEHSNPAPTATTWVLDLPAVVDKADGPGTPDLENYNEPPPLTVITDRTVTVPFYLVTDNDEERQRCSLVAGLVVTGAAFVPLVFCRPAALSMAPTRCPESL
ncbi:hypothetical protein [Nonomuraea insulae]|uniref:Uncharacterized protein n=1 Tax=Nonomuraea insulae TaxID=1616787 RepID=A0ABW1DDJ5_9ACTN